MPRVRPFRASTDVGSMNQEKPSAVAMADVVTFGRPRLPKRGRQAWSYTALPH